MTVGEKALGCLPHILGSNIYFLAVALVATINTTIAKLACIVCHWWFLSG